MLVYPRKQAGLSFIELLVVISIVAILISFVPLGMDFIHREWLTSATKELYADFQKARLDAMTQGSQQVKGVGIRLVSPTSYVLFNFNDCNQNYSYESNGCAGDREESSARTATIPSSITLRTFTGGAVATPANTLSDIVIYDKFGVLRNSTWGLVQSFAVLTTSSRNNQTKCINFGMNTIREGLWNASTNTCAVQ